ncbi:porin [Hymenobacter actinosclerus]|uniref:Putative beta-barrel porin-2, OmpL-like. bbp2 n=1 Tax=Hymenobacter actinosclerus TaxID=82805 RepID=A0A1I0DW40_9BACT|nr:porin [Hymenobacter actinosclerus]SET36855.1 Putative beta-barrel porin-2, OmpL-like. bbp2 [Hymenobacter actinosclerus]
MKALLTLSLALLAAGGASAQTTAAPADSAAPNPLTVYGFVDGYYGYDFKYAPTNTRPAFLYSHNRQNEFTINQGLVGLRYDNGQVRGAIGLHAGSYPSANYAAEDPVLRHIYEGYAGFRPFNKAWLDVGIFASHIGFESALSKDNWTLTRSLMAENSPYYEAGARFTYEVAPRLTLTGLVLNGWQNIRETNQGKALGTQLQWRPTAKLLINSSTFYGNEQPPDSVRRRRYFHNFYATYAATSRLSLALVFDVGKQESERRGGKADTWHTGAAFVRYQLAPQWSATARAEYYHADRGVLIGSGSPRPGDPGFRVKAASLNLDYAPAANVVVRVEGRLMDARRPIFEQRNSRNADSYGNLTSSIALSF